MGGTDGRVESGGTEIASHRNTGIEIAEQGIGIGKEIGSIEGATGIRSTEQGTEKEKEKRTVIESIEGIVTVSIRSANHVIAVTARSRLRGLAPATLRSRKLLSLPKMND